MLKGSVAAQTSEGVMILPPGVAASGVGSALKALPTSEQVMLIFISGGNNSLVLKDITAIAVHVWMVVAHESKFKNLILCDTGAIFMTARINGTPLSLDAYSDLSRHS